MSKKNLTASYKIAIGGIFTALAVVVMLISCIVPTATYACPALAGIMLTPVIVEVGRRWAICSYVAVSLLSFFVVPYKETALCFAAFFGFYPVLKAVFEQYLSKVLCWICKIFLFSVCMVVVFFISVFLLGIPKDSYTILGVYLPWVILAIGIFVFLIYDIAFSRIICAYVTIWRKKFLKRIL